MKMKDCIICNRCGTQVQKELELDYPYYCPECDENMYRFEVHLAGRPALINTE